MAFRSGFITIIGRPNVGKSTLLNGIIGQKIAIMSNKPQTTRHKITGVYNAPDAQMIFVDTPGIHKSKNKLGDFMVSSAKRTIEDVDLVLLMTDASGVIGPGDRYLLELLAGSRTPVLAVINKIDTLSPESLRTIFDAYAAEGLDEVMAISALDEKGIQAVLKSVRTYLPEGPAYYPTDTMTDQTERTLISEIIREKTLHYLDDEIPHGIAVEVTKVKQRPQKELYDVEATIICEKASHKGIVIGKQGRKLKGIGKSARTDIEALLQGKVNLQLWVKVREGWRDNTMLLKGFGYKE